MAIGLAFDTETTGILEFKLPRNHPTQPDLVQLGIILFDDETGEEFTKIDLLVEPQCEIDAKAQEIHGKSKEFLSKYGVSRKAALSIFHYLMLKADFLLAHNMNFDSGILHAAYAKENISPDIFLQKKTECSMLMTTDLMKLPNPRFPGRYKWPSLDEAYRKYVDPNGFEGAHDAMADIRACKAVYMAVKKLNQGT